jgi:spore coat protein CotH
MAVKWNCLTRIFDFSVDLGVNKLSIYNLLGRVFFDCNLSYKKRLVYLPIVSNGLYLLKLSGEKGALFTSKINLNSSRSNFSFKTTGKGIINAAASDGKTLIFRHDDYYPLDYTVQTSSQNVFVGMQSDPRSFVFDKKKVHSYYFAVNYDDSVKMERDARLENYVPAVFKFNDSAFGQVGFRYKGSDYSLPNCFSKTGVRENKPECKKISYKVKFNEYDSTARLYNMKSLNLHSMSADNTKMHDMLGYEMFREMGIYSPRASYARVYVNGVFQGLFIAVEKIDGRFTKSRWPVYGDGNLYKEAWPGRTNPDIFTEKLETNNDRDDSGDIDPSVVKKMVDLGKTLKAASSTTFIDSIGPYFDFDYLIHYLVVDRAIKNWDGITAFYGTTATNRMNHNYYLYEEENQGGKLWLIPWDLDNTFRKTDPYIEDARLPNWNVECDSCVPYKVWAGKSTAIPSNCDKFLKLTAATLWGKFVTSGEEYLKTSFDTTFVRGKVDSYSVLIDSIVKKDPVIDYPLWQRNVTTFKKTLLSIRKDFDQYIHGITDKADDTSDYSEPFISTSGKLVLDRTNNFEFTSIPDTNFSFYEITAGSVASVRRDTIKPLWGSADLQFSFTFNPIADTETYSEYSAIGIMFDSISDLNKIRKINVSLSCDNYRDMWVFLGSPLYKSHGTANEYGWFINVDPVSKVYELKFEDLDYPEWASVANPELLDSVLLNSTSLVFCPNPQFDGAGELSIVPDSGFLKIDNIQFILKD